jgi:DNA-binding PadR family transcriptional regulator
MVVLSMIADGIEDLYGQYAIKRLGESLGVGGNVNKTTIQNSLRRLEKKNLITKIDYGTYQFEDEAFSDWVKYKED